MYGGGRAGILLGRKAREGRALARKKKKKARPAMGRIEVRAEAAWIADLARRAQAWRMSRSAFIRLACQEKMARPAPGEAGAGTTSPP
jgi:hypothetical protein